VQVEPDNPANALLFGTLLRRTEQTDKAIEAFQKVLELDPNNTKAKRYLGELNAPLTSQPADTPPPAEAAP
jgi:cytochrome c-type biogenesis protein CcmH/NrfG